MNIQFQDPPERTIRDWDSVAQALRANPGRWALIGEDEGISVANAIRQGIKAIPKEGGFEMTTSNTRRDVSPPTCDIYLRYNAEADTTLTDAERERAIGKQKKNLKEK